ncbi:MAG TPA: hypothetical protein VGM57_07440 [Pseudolabrys sp.]
MRDIGVIYLCRFAEGEEPVRRFLATYRAHDAGVDHDLHVVFKGFPDRVSLEKFYALFDGFDINPIELDDSGFDLGAYVRAAQAVSNRRVIFLNTFSQIQDANWLRHFDNAINAPNAGVVGATGSWQSNAASYERTLKRLLAKVGIFQKDLVPHSRPEGGSFQLPLTMQTRSPWRYLLSPFRYSYNVFEYGRHPNPHIRTNAFMVDRSQFLTLRFPSFANKTDAYKFESGRLSLTRQYIARGLKVVVVGRNGQAYAIDQWRNSGTFWTGDQSNLIVADNRTADYVEGSEKLRAYLEHIAWVDPWARP